MAIICFPAPACARLLLKSMPMALYSTEAIKHKRVSLPAWIALFSTHAPVQTFSLVWSDKMHRVMSAALVFLTHWIK